jgi:hypothetical protein
MYPGAAAEGLLMNVRMVNATFEDPNRKDFDPDANTAAFLKHMPEYAAHGVRAFTLCLQGGMPGYEGAVNSAFNEDGSLRDTYLARVARVIEACDRHGVAVILGCFYQRQDQVLSDEAAVRAGVVNVVHWIERQGYTNVVLEIANEFPHGGFDHKLLRSAAGEAELVRLAKATQPKLLVSTSGIGDGRLPDAVAEASDFLLIHFNGVKLEDIPARIQALQRYGKPIVCNEDDKTGAAAARAAELSVENRASWGLMLSELNQYFPLEYHGAVDDPVVYAKLKTLTSAISSTRRAANEDGGSKIEDGKARDPRSSILDPPRQPPRLIILTDIGGDPDDRQSMIRLMLYANEFEIEGLIATAAGVPGELNEAATKPELVREIVEAYGQVRGNLARHAEGYPPAEELLAKVKSGNRQRGERALGAAHDTDGSRWIIEVVDRDDPRPVNVAIWGGQTDFAQALCACARTAARTASRSSSPGSASTTSTIRTASSGCSRTSRTCSTSSARRPRAGTSASAPTAACISAATSRSPRRSGSMSTCAATTARWGRFIPTQHGPRPTRTWDSRKATRRRGCISSRTG